MAVVGMMVHAERTSAFETASDAARWLAARGHTVRLGHEDAARCGLDGMAVRDDEFVRGLDLMVAVGGDGTILRAVDRAAVDDVPVLGVNAGQLGYLSTAEQSGLRIALKRFLAGSYTIEERMRLRAVVSRPNDDPEVLVALNEVVFERVEVGHTIRLDVSFDGDPFTSYVADGLIVATPTGSTAYAFSVRGPIIEPTHRAILVAPVAPHMLFDHALVLRPDTVVTVAPRGERVHVSVDGRMGCLAEDGWVIECSAASPARLVSFGHHDFHRTLREKFGLSAR